MAGYGAQSYGGNWSQGGDSWSQGNSGGDSWSGSGSDDWNSNSWNNNNAGGSKGWGKDQGKQQGNAGKGAVVPAKGDQGKGFSGKGMSDPSSKGGSKDGGKSEGKGGGWDGGKSDGKGGSWDGGKSDGKGGSWDGGKSDGKSGGWDGGKSDGKGGGWDAGKSDGKGGGWDAGKSDGKGGGWDAGKSDGKGGKFGKDNGKGGKGPQKLTNLKIECHNPSMVASIVSGNFALNGENHGKSAFKKDQQVSGLDVIVYFWDERDGAELCGWYVAPEIGGNQVWAFIPSKDDNPPQTGWQVPYGGAVDPSFKLTYGGGAQQQQPQPQQQPQQQKGQWGKQQQPQQQEEQQPQQQKGQWGQQQQKGQWGQQQPQQQKGQWGKQQQPQQQEEEQTQQQEEQQPQQQKGQWGKQQKGQWGKQQQPQQQEEDQPQQQEEQQPQQQKGQWGKQQQKGQWGKQQQQPQQQEEQQPQQQKGQWGKQQQKGQWGKQQTEQQSQQSWGNQQKWQQEPQQDSWDSEQSQEEWGEQTQDWNQESSGQWQQQDYQTKQQTELQKKREAFEAQKAKKEAEAAAKKAEIEAKREALMKKKQEEMAKKEAEAQAKKEAEAKKLAERKAAINVRRVIQKVRVAKAEDFETLQAEMEECFNTEAENLGDMLEAVSGEKDKAVEQAQTRIEAAAEKKRKEEEAKAEAERKKKEAEENAKLLLEEFSNLADSAEAQLETLKELVKPTEEEEAFATLKKPDIDKLVSDFESSAAEAQSILKMCATFVREKGEAMKGPSPNAEVKQNITKQTQRITECKKTMEATIKNGQGMVAKAKLRSLAMGKTEKLETLFKQFDKDNDGLLNEAEAKVFCKTKCKFTPAGDVWSTMWSRIKEDEDAKGVALEGMTAIKMMAGIEKERARDAARKATRIEKERVIKEMKDTVLKRVKEAGSVMKKANNEMAEIEVQFREAFSRREREKAVDEMLLFADTLDTLAVEGRTKLESVQKTLTALTEGADKKHEGDLRSFLKTELRPLENIGQRFGMRVERVEKVSKDFRSMALRKTGVELKKKKKDALKVVKYNQRFKRQEPEEFFAAIDTKGDGAIDEEEWLEFFQYAESDIREIFLEEVKKEPEEKAEDETGEDAETKEETGEEEKEAKEEEAKEEEPPLETIDLSADDLTNIFRDLAPEGEIAKDVFLRLIRHTMKVVSSTVMTENSSMSVVGGKMKSVRRLEKDEVVEVLLGPMMDKASKVNRVKARAVKDSKEGWCTVTGNSGSQFLTDGGSTFKVTKQVDLTTDFELGENGSEESGKEALKVGTVLEVLELPSKEEQSGNMRMYVQVQDGGSVGWVTSTSKSGIAFVQAL